MRTMTRELPLALSDRKPEGIQAHPVGNPGAHANRPVGYPQPDAFTGAADFSGMDGTRDLFIGHVAHKAYVSVNEEGTEAAGASGVGMTYSIPQYEIMLIDRPFIFLIRDIETGAILFIGRVMDPNRH